MLLRKFFSYYAPFKGLFALDFGCAVVAGLLELAFPMAIKLFIDRLLPAGDWTLIIVAAAALLVVYVMNAGMMAIVTYWGHMLGINIETEMRRKAFDHLQKLSFSFYDGAKTGHLTARVTKDLEEVGELAHHGPEEVFLAIMTFVGAFLLMATINLELALIVGAIVPAIGWLTMTVGTRMTHNFRALFRRVGAFNARLEENIGGMRVVQAFANEAHETALFADDNQKYRTIKLQAYRLMAANSALSYFGLRLIQVIVMVTGTWFVIKGELTAGGFVSFLLLITIFFGPIEKINRILEMYPKGIAGFRSYLDLLAIEPDIVDRPGAIAAPDLRGDIRYEGVHFAYSTSLPVLKGIDLAIGAGETVAFVGPSGAGKTTICSLLPRFYEPQAGRILIDGIDIRDMTITSLRRQIGIVQQDVFLFAGTIRENVAYGRLGASEADILAAVRAARIEDLVASLPDGLDTVIGERGVKLSGGQKQRLAIARIFLKDPPILVLDEATSALDTETERQIQASLAALSQGRTTLVIAHRLATIRGADRIVVVTPDGVAEQGRHAELIARGGLYSRLHETQFAAE
ncbi:ABC transporter ATP-binding protein [Acuticoccus sp. I52.16.1]|uniref:ABC transporter ATP-binding protein n=1 Tax=Acuticoccus sp. I52.16.1 TaxID=2928472 RepID=UPI001FD41B52|nr:ABC transporter ATP-binding protein [Acuticoccus sp. I52.16.1]UOM34633.1 ABC transporter ATP-binding protein/permease [Acuticoccus sp. I52.16.1]